MCAGEPVCVRAGDVHTHGHVGRDGESVCPCRLGSVCVYAREDEADKEPCRLAGTASHIRAGGNQASPCLGPHPGRFAVLGWGKCRFWCVRKGRSVCERERVRRVRVSPLRDTWGSPLLFLCHPALPEGVGPSHGASPRADTARHRQALAGWSPVLIAATVRVRKSH